MNTSSQRALVLTLVAALLEAMDAYAPQTVSWD